MSGYQRTRAWRVAHPEYAEREKRRNAARQRALVRLAHAHPEDFRALYDEELSLVDLSRDTSEPVP